MIELIPAIDIIDGRCVRLSQGDYSQKSDYGITPIEMAKRYEAIGIKRLHVVDLDGAKASQPQNLKAVEQVCSNTALEVQFGGGIKSGEALESVFSSGVRRAICGSVAVTSPELFEQWIESYGGDRVTLGADIKDGSVAISGWLESGNVTLEALAERYRSKGGRHIICTDISKDGMLQGPNFNLYSALQQEFPEVEVTVSGGISSMADIERLNDMGLQSVIIGKAIYEGHIKLEELELWLQRG